VETAVGVVDVKSSPVYFYVQTTETYDNAGTIIPFDTEQLNVGGGMNITSGIFTAPKSGIYFFSFNGLKDFQRDALGVSLYHNSIYITQAYGALGPNYNPVALTSTLRLRSGDQISLLLDYGQLKGNQSRNTNFIGMLLQEEMLG
jgi:C1q-related factor